MPSTSRTPPDLGPDGGRPPTVRAVWPPSEKILEWPHSEARAVLAIDLLSHASMSASSSSPPSSSALCRRRSFRLCSLRMCVSSLESEAGMPAATASNPQRFARRSTISRTLSLKRFFESSAQSSTPSRIGLT